MAGFWDISRLAHSRVWRVMLAVNRGPPQRSVSPPSALGLPVAAWTSSQHRAAIWTYKVDVNGTVRV